MTYHTLRAPLTSLAALAVVLTAEPAGASRDLMSADGAGGTYDLLKRSYGIEVPDCGHMVPHMTEDMDADLGRPVFVFHAHVNQDDDRCRNTDRQRTEIRGLASVGGPEGTTRYYRWKFKLPTGFKASGAFTHIFQIKAYGNGHGSGAPIMTLTPRNDTFAIDGRIGKHGTTSLGKFLGNWVVVDMKILHANAGRLEATIKNLKTGEMLFSYSGNHDMWDDGAGASEPKFGIYRSLNERGALRDEQVRFNDFCVATNSASECDDGGSPPPPPPSDAGAATGGEDAGAPVMADAGTPVGSPDAATSAPRDSGSSSPDPTPVKADAGSTPRPPAKADAAPSTPEDPDPGQEEETPSRSAKAGGCTAGGGAGSGGLWLLALAMIFGVSTRRMRRSIVRSRMTGEGEALHENRDPALRPHHRAGRGRTV